jgi:hypothetical protein
MTSTKQARRLIKRLPVARGNHLYTTTTSTTNNKYKKVHLLDRRGGSKDLTFCTFFFIVSTTGNASIPSTSTLGSRLSE